MVARYEANPTSGGHAALTTLVPLAAMIYLILLARVVALADLGLAVPTGFLVRTFIIMHDCGTARSCRRRSGTTS
jgi:hypothetical protein